MPEILVRRLACFSLIALALTLPTHTARAESADCAANRAALAQLDGAIAQLDNAGLPARLAGDMTDIVNQLIEGLNATKKDLAGITDPVNKVTSSFDGAKEKLDALMEKLRGMKRPLPRGLEALRGRIDEMAGNVGRGIERFKNSPAGQVGQGLDKAGEFIGTVVEKLESAKTALEGVKALDDARNGTGAEQIRAMKYGFDQLKGHLAIDEVPGLGAFLDAYSEAMGGIADSVDIIERTLKERLKMADEALRDTDFGNLDRLYPGLQSPREKQQARLAALRDQRTALQARRDADGCDRPPPPVDACADPKRLPDTARRLVDGMARNERETYDNAHRNYRDLMSELANLAFAEPRLTTTPQHRDLIDYQSTLNQLRRAAAANDMSSYGGRDPLAGLPEMAQALGATLPPAARDWQANANRFLPILTEALARNRQAADRRAQAELEARTSVWHDQMRALVTATKTAAARDTAAKQAFDQRIGDALAREAQAKNWTKAQADEFDQCFPRYGALRQASTARLFPPGKPTAGAPKAKPAEKDCRNTGGLAGALNKEACQIGK